MPSDHLTLCRSLLLLPSIFPSIRVFSNESALHIRWPMSQLFLCIRDHLRPNSRNVGPAYIQILISILPLEPRDKTPQLIPLGGWDTQFLRDTMCPLRPSLLCKGTKLLFPPSPKLLSLRFNFAPEHKGRALSIISSCLHVTPVRGCCHCCLVTKSRLGPLWLHQL